MEELGRKSPEEMKALQKHPVIVILDDVRSMHNVGSAFRTCDAFAVTELCLCGYTPAPPHRDIHKTALGATDTVPWKSYATTAEAITAARNAGYTIMAIEQAHNSVMLNNMGAIPEKLALIFGNEVAGVCDEALQMADGCMEIPQWGAKHSLNVSVTIGIVLWQLVNK